MVEKITAYNFVKMLMLICLMYLFGIFYFKYCLELGIYLDIPRLLAVALGEVVFNIGYSI